MKKIYIISSTILIFILSLHTSINAQITAYTRTLLSGQTYTQISGGTVINSTTQLSAVMSQNADDGAAIVTLPFTFTYNGTGFTTATFCTNGWLGMGSQTSVSASQSRAQGNLWTTTVPNNTIAAWFGDMSANFPTGSGSMVHGTMGTGIYAFEWRNATGSGFGQTTTNLINFMIKLYGPASSNPGRIEILYGSQSGSLTTGRTIGIEDAVGGSNHYINALNGSSTSTSTAGSWPGSGTGYRFEPPCTGTPAPGNTITSATPVCLSQTFTLSLQNTLSGSGLSYQWQSSPDGSTWSNIAGATSSTLATTETSTLQYRNRVTCTPSSSSGNSTPVTVTLGTAHIVSTTPGTACVGAASGSVSVTPSPGATVQWYSASTGGTLLGSGNTLNITSPTTTTTYYALPSASGGAGTHTITPGTSNSQRGAMLDIKPLTNMTLTGFDWIPASTGTYSVAIYYKVGTLVGSETNSSAWTLIGTATNVSVTASTPSTITFSSPPALTANQVYGFYVVRTSASLSIRYWNGGTFGSLWSSNSDLETYAGKGYSGLFSGSAFSPRTLGGTFRYSTAPPCANSSVRTGVTLTMTSPPAITGQPISTTTICQNTNTSFSVTASGGGINYQWQVSTNGGSTWSNLTNVAPYSNVTAATININNAPTSLNGNKYRCIVIGACAPILTSNTVDLTVNPVPVITGNPASVSICPAANHTFSVTATGFSLGYQWQLSTNGGSTWANLSNTAPYSNVTTSAMTITNASLSMNNYQYRCVVTGGCSPVAISNAAVLSLNATITITSQPPVQQTACLAGTATITFGVTGATTFQWYGDFGAGFVIINNNTTYSGATTNTLTISNVPPTATGTYRCIVGSGCIPPFATNTSIINVYPPTVITTQPSSVTNCSGVNTYFTVNATGSVLSYRWQVSTNGGSTWANLTASATYGGVNANQLTIFNTPASLNTYQYRCVVTGSCASVATSNAAILTVNTPPGSTNPANAIACLGTNTSYTVTGSGTSISYQWQVYNNITWTNVVNNAIYAGATTNSLALTGVTAAMNGYAYRVVVNGICPNNPYFSNQASLTVNMPPSVTAAPTDKTICLGGSTSYSVSATGTPALAYQWQADQGSGFVNLANGANYNGVTTTTLNVIFPPLNFNGYKYRCAISGPCAPPAISALATLTIDDTATVTSVPYNDTNCTGDTSIFAINPGGPVTNIQWQESDGFGGFIDLPMFTPPYIGVNSPMLMIAPSSTSLSGKQYRAVVSSTCNTVISNTFSLITYIVPEIVLDPVDQTVPQEQDAHFHVEASDSGYIYYWQASSDTGNNFSNIYNNNMYSGVQSKTLTVIKVNPAENGWLFRCIVKDTKGYCYKEYDTSYAAKLTVGPLPPFPTNVVTVSTGNVKFSVYPNPVHGNELMVQADNPASKSVHYRIIDQFGRTLQDEQITLSQLNKAPISVANLISGVYTIQFIDEKNAVNQSIRFTKQQ